MISINFENYFKKFLDILLDENEKYNIFDIIYKYNDFELVYLFLFAFIENFRDGNINLTENSKFVEKFKGLFYLLDNFNFYEIFEKSIFLKQNEKLFYSIKEVVII